MSYLPRYYDTPKGKIIHAVIIQRCYDFRSIQRATGIRPKELQGLISELLSEGILSLWENSRNLKVENETYWEWFNFLLYGPDFSFKPDAISIKEGLGEGIIDWIQNWLSFYRKEYNLLIPVGNNHFYLDSPLLIDFLSHIIRKANQQIIVFTPWIEDINLTKLLILSCEHKCEVIVITREPNHNAKREWEVKQAHEQARCHNELRDAGVEIRYKNNIHGKLLILDKEVAIASSFNFTRNPASGTSWEAGIVTYEKGIVNGILTSIENYLL